MKNQPIPPIPMSSPDLTDAERQAVLEVVHTPNLSMGPKIKLFEDAFRQYTGSKHAIGVSAGTSGLHLCIRAIDIQPHDIVITTPFSFVASTNVILYENGLPVFVDVDHHTGNIDPSLLSQAVADLVNSQAGASRWLPNKGVQGKGRLKAILPVDVFGQPADMDPIRHVCDQFNLSLIEDSCEALGAEYKDRKAGTLGDFGVFAFYPNKQITTGEGGLVITNDDRAADLMRALRNQGRAPGDTWLQHTYLGYNYRLDEMSAALGIVQLSRLDELLASRNRVAGWYNRHLKNIRGVTPPYLSPATTRVSWFVYVIKLDHGINRDRVAQTLERQGIHVRPYFLPIHLQPYMVERFGYQQGAYPVTEDLGRRCLALPFSGKMSEEQVLQVSQALQNSLP
jgi:perosamine synthetase